MPMSKRTLFLIFALFIIIFVLLAVTVYNPDSKPKQNNPLQEILKISPAKTILSFGQLTATSSSATTVNYSIPINIQSGSNKITAVQLEMQYDPKALTNVAVTPSAFFKNPQILLSQIDEKTGRITYAFGIGLEDEALSGQGEIAALNFEVEKGQTIELNIIFLPKTLVTAEGVSESVLKQANLGRFTIGQ